MSMPHSLNEAIAVEIRVEMTRQDISQEELATRIGYTQPTLSRKLDGLRPLNVEDLDQIGRALGIPVITFFHRGRAALSTAS